MADDTGNSAAATLDGGKTENNPNNSSPSITTASAKAAVVSPNKTAAG